MGEILIQSKGPSYESKWVIPTTEVGWGTTFGRLCLVAVGSGSGSGAGGVEGGVGVAAAVGVTGGSFRKNSITSLRFLCISVSVTACVSIALLWAKSICSGVTGAGFSS